MRRMYVKWTRKETNRYVNVEINDQRPETYLQYKTSKLIGFDNTAYDTTK